MFAAISNITNIILQNKVEILAHSAPFIGIYCAKLFCKKLVFPMCVGYQQGVVSLIFHKLLLKKSCFKIGTNIALSFILSWSLNKFGIISDGIFDYLSKQFAQILYFGITSTIMNEQIKAIIAIQSMQMLHPALSYTIKFFALNSVWCVPYAVSCLQILCSKL